MNELENSLHKGGDAFPFNYIRLDKSCYMKSHCEISLSVSLQIMRCIYYLIIMMHANYVNFSIYINKFTSETSHVLLPSFIWH